MGRARCEGGPGPRRAWAAGRRDGPFDDWDEHGQPAPRVVPDSVEKHAHGLCDLDEHGSERRDGCGAEDDLFASCRVCDCGESHLASSVAEGVDADPDLRELFPLCEREAGLFFERVEQLAVDVALCDVFRHAEHLGPARRSGKGST